MLGTPDAGAANLDLLIGQFNPETAAEYTRLAISSCTSDGTTMVEAASGSFPGARAHLASALSFLLYRWPDSFEETDFARHAQDIFDSSLSSIYKNAGLDHRAQAFQKRDAVREAWEALRAAFLRLSEAQLPLDALSQFRQRLLQIFNSERAKLLLHPLLPSRFQDVLILATLKELDQYLAADGAEKRDAAHSTEESIRGFREIMNGTPLILREFISPAFDALFQAFAESWTTDPSNLPASITLDPRGYRYPLNQVGCTFDISIVLKNEGPGVAWDVTITYMTDLAFHERELYIGTLEPGTIVIQLPETVEEMASPAAVTCAVRWSDSSGSQSLPYEFTIECQRSDVDWPTLSSRSPYSTEPVFKEHQFFGRQEMLDILIRRLAQDEMPSFYVIGQKRVGKTSFVQRIAELTHARTNYQTRVLFISPEYYIAATAHETVLRLAQHIGRELSRYYPDICRPLSTPISELRDLTPFFDALQAAGKRIVIAIDEFDEIPAELYEENSSQSRAFFLALRGISTQPHISFIVVGSETLELVMREQGQRLNKWAPLKLDYFSKDSSWNDYCDLIVKPVDNEIDYGDEAIDELYKITSGHPYFTKLLCQRIIDHACQRRLSWITDQSVSEASHELVEELDSGPFQHFWKDGLIGSSAQQEQQRFLRQRLLLAAADLSRKRRALSYESVLNHPSVVNIAASARPELSQFFARRIFTGDQSNFEFRVTFFIRWLERKGTEQVAATIEDSSHIIEQLVANAHLAISSKEIVDVSRDWIYKAHHVTTDEVRAWLEQFGGPEEQRLAFRVLAALDFIRADSYQREFGLFAQAIQHRLPAIIRGGTRKRGDMIVSYLDSPGKSGAALARKFADSARILTDRIVERGRLATRLSGEDPVSALIFVDDFIGSGDTACAGIEAVWAECGDIIKQRGMFVFFLCAAATDYGRDRVVTLTQSLYSRFEVNIVTIFGDERRVFSPQSQTFTDEIERERARELFAKHGKALEPRNPLGYHEGQLAVVFEANCPNNSLPVLWKTRGSWKALFPRFTD
jgi:hypothetical protein